MLAPNVPAPTTTQRTGFSLGCMTAMVRRFAAATNAIQGAHRRDRPVAVR
jgi:hypothetical protein